MIIIIILLLKEIIEDKVESDNTYFIYSKLDRSNLALMPNNLSLCPENIVIFGKIQTDSQK